VCCNICTDLVLTRDCSSNQQICSCLFSTVHKHQGATFAIETVVIGLVSEAVTWCAEEGRTKDVGVLVHCLAGVSRSVTVTVAYLMFSLSLSLEDAYEFLRRVRPNISPNFNFMGQLADFDQTLQYAREHCTCLSMAAPLLSLCESCRRQVKTYFSTPPVPATAGAASAAGAGRDDVSSSSSPFSVSSLTSSTSTHSLPHSPLNQ